MLPCFHSLGLSNHSCIIISFFLCLFPLMNSAYQSSILFCSFFSCFHCLGLFNHSFIIISFFLSLFFFSLPDRVLLLLPCSLFPSFLSRGLSCHFSLLPRSFFSYFHSLGLSYHSSIIISFFLSLFSLLRSVLSLLYYLVLSFRVFTPEICFITLFICQLPSCTLFSALIPYAASVILFFSCFCLTSLPFF